MEVGIANLYVSWNLARICRYWMIVKKKKLRDIKVSIIHGNSYSP